VLGLCALEAYAWTLGAMPLADAWILQAMNPVFVALLAPLILKERSAGHIWLALVLGLGGAALIVRPGFPVVAGPLALPFALPVWVWPNLVETAAMVGAAVAAAGGQYLLTVGLKSSHAAPATTSTYVGFVFATALGLVFFDEPLVWTTVVGSVSIFAGVALLGRRAVTVRPTAARGVAPTVTTET
jgi:drug/metabolite transporter (DMT)-like permease